MRRIFLTAALGVMSISAFAQGTLVFDSAGTVFGIDWKAEVFDTDGTPLSGNAWSADLYWAAVGVTDSTLLRALNQPATFSNVPAQAGFFFGGVRTIPLYPYGNGLINAQVRVWDTASGNSWAAAAVRPGARVGQSIVFQHLLADLPSGVGVPGPPLPLFELDGHPWSVHVVSLPAILNYQVSGGDLVLSWSQGVLQSSTQVNGTYIGVTTVSPYRIALGASGSQRFYRLWIP